MSLKSMGPSRGGRGCRGRERRIHHNSEKKIEDNVMRGKLNHVTKSEYARMRNYSKSYVTKLIHKGMIVLSSDGLVNISSSDKLLKDNQDPAREPFRKEGNSKAKGKNAGRTKDKGKDKDTEEISYTQARAERERIKAKREKIEYDLLIGKLVNSEEVRISAFNRARILRDAMFNIPDRIASILAAETNPRKVHQILFKEIRTALEEQSNAKC